MRDLLTAFLKGVELTSALSYESCFVRKIDTFESTITGTNGLLVLDEKLGELHVLHTQPDKAEKMTQISCLLTPMPSSKLNSMLLSPNGSLLALCTHTSVHLLDVGSIIQPKRTSSMSSAVKTLYCAFDTADHIAITDRTRSFIRRLRWHPNLPNTLVLLTSHSGLYYIHCTRLDGARGVQSRMQFEVNAADLYRTRHGRQMDGCQLAEDSYSDDSGGEFGAEDGTWSRASYNCLDLAGALGTICVDFAFGAPLPTPSRGPKKRSRDALCSQDSSVYLLFESGDVMLLSNCLTTPNPSQLNSRMLQIMPPSFDNYGEEFCSILSICASQTLAQDLSSMLDTSSAIPPPDVLVLTNRDGQLFHGVVLHTTDMASGKRRAIPDGPSLCLVDLVHLQSPANRMTDTKVNTSPTNEDSDSEDFTLVLEPARLGSTLSDGTAVPPSLWSYTHGGYYVIHPAGLHLVRLPWLRELCGQSQSISERVSNSDGQGDKDAGLSARDWHSIVTHLVCGQLTTVASTGDGQTASESDPGQYRLAALMEFNRPTGRLLNPLLNDASRFGICGEATELLLVRAPVTPSENTSSLVQLVSIGRDLCPSIEVATSAVGSGDVDDGQIQSLSSQPSGPQRSEFALQLQRQLRQEELHLPLIAALSMQSDLSNLQVIQFFMKATATLSEGSLDRLIRARHMVEQYTTRVATQLSHQYAQASELSDSRIVLQTKAEELTQRHAVLIERQAMLDKRLGTLACRLNDLCEEPCSAEVAMRDELTQLRGRLRKGLRTWQTRLRLKCNAVEQRVDKMHITPRTSLTPQRASGQGQPQWSQLSTTLQQQTMGVKQLVNQVKTLTLSKMLQSN